MLFNPLVIKISVEGGKCMDYRIVKTRNQKFLAVVNKFSNEIINDPENHDVADFWDVCQENHAIEALLALRPAGKKDLYGLCAPAVAGADFFEYGIGILLDADTQEVDLQAMAAVGYRLWEVTGGCYVVFDCVGEDGDAITQTWARFYQEFLPQMGYEARQASDYEIYPEQGEEGVFCQLWIPVQKTE